MPPSMPNPSKRMTANPARPVARYRPGKPVAEQESSDEEEESEQEHQLQQQQNKSQRKPPARPQRQAPAPQAEESEDEDEDGFVTDPEDGEDGEDNLETAKTSTERSTAGVSQDKPVQRQKPPEDGRANNSSEEDDDDSEGEDSSSEEEAPRRKFQRPTFIKKSDRKQSQSIPPSLGEADTTTSQIPNSTPQPTTEVDEQARRLAQADLLIKDKLERDVIARAQGKKAWDDDEDLLPENLVDDTDGLDPDAEHAAWKLRELQRLKRDREALISREKELEEIDRRRNLTAEERDAEDRAFLDKQKQEREDGKADSGPQYLARYHHKGAFFQGDENAEFLKKRDVMGARFEDQVADKSVLPEYMRLRDMTKLGKKGRTRYTDLKGQDTGRFGEDVKRWRGSGGRGDGEGRGGAEFDTRGLDDRFLPDDQRGGGRTGPTGANASIVNLRKDHEPSRRSRDDVSSRDRDHGFSRSDTRRSLSRSRSRSRSPPQASRRKHSRSRSPVARKRRHVDDSRDRDRNSRHHDRSGYRERSREREAVRDRDRDRDRRRDS
ncbi:hypothetical protein LTR84_009200 [Exophiala bonariae]|uniref:Micro-fibrillar-associated protein 1 C-terminal domain-containing protein n=1 Tax=Exophiala bonariae TaxID=1690606 RepID=A0AAV9MXX8_9EURO|nr:hypothetical protein LTR84_009200 [Exophiala bonariae]